MENFLCMLQKIVEGLVYGKRVKQKNLFENNEFSGINDSTFCIIDSKQSQSSF